MPTSLQYDTDDGTELGTFGRERMRLQERKGRVKVGCGSSAQGPMHKGFNSGMQFSVGSQVRECFCKGLVELAEPLLNLGVEGNGKDMLLEHGGILHSLVSIPSYKACNCSSPNSVFPESVEIVHGESGADKLGPLCCATLSANVHASKGTAGSVMHCRTPTISRSEAGVAPRQCLLPLAFDNQG
eukprot:CAMPEP_0169180396 /NCGR_PEP_ID=MMETSP1015-20121227/68153_1 /TAXON_ID=342587 /ORGANISM="Karlodinium micrum, Strain CCMP2283" /LENGTH=184 /DNA_ID=CAMNT_0009255511 /DNA_START=415 /DNA_END=969 /DNA_ORIENTATION=-